MKMPKSNDETAIADLVDFYKRWPDLRDQALEIQAEVDLSQSKRALLEWMIMVIDRVGPADLEPIKEMPNV